MVYINWHVYIHSQHRIVQSFENIAISLAQQENFTELTVTNENITVRIENVSNYNLHITVGGKDNEMYCN